MPNANRTIQDMIRTQLARRLVLSVAAFALIAGVSPALAADQADERIDRAMGAFENPKLLQILTSAPAPRVGHHGAQPFDQEPPAAQVDFRPKIVTCFVDANKKIVCQ